MLNTKPLHLSSERQDAAQDAMFVFSLVKLLPGHGAKGSMAVKLLMAVSVKRERKCIIRNKESHTSFGDYR